MIYDKSVVMMSKNPITDPGKKSKEGLLTVECKDGVLSTVVAKTIEAYAENQAKSILKTYYEDGLLVLFGSLQKMRISCSEVRISVLSLSRASTLASPASGSAAGRVIFSISYHAAQDTL